MNILFQRSFVDFIKHIEASIIFLLRIGHRLTARTVFDFANPLGRMNFFYRGEVQYNGQQKRLNFMVSFLDGHYGI